MLHDISFHATPGTVTALCGPSGGGKSTILSLIAAFHGPSRGTIRIDGTDLATVRLDAHRAQLGVVLQETFLFAGTILENIALARPGATRESVVRAARMAHVDEFTDRLPLGYDSLIGERGVRLSGGERQRIALARAFLADPPILILDEATSNLDANSEALIQEALAEIVVGRTTFVIAHRLSTIQRATRSSSSTAAASSSGARTRSSSSKGGGGLYGEMHARQQFTGEAPSGPPAASEQSEIVSREDMPRRDDLNKSLLIGAGGPADASRRASGASLPRPRSPSTPSGRSPWPLARPSAGAHLPEGGPVTR